jgi:predicted methyltransferase
MEKIKKKERKVVSKNKISCIVLACDSHVKKGKSVFHCLTSIFNQDFESFEIIIVENSYNKKGRNNEIKSFCKEQNKKRRKLVNVQIVNNKKSISQGSARNKGAELASSDLLLFIDDDTIILNNNAFDLIWKKSKNYDYGYGAKRKWTGSNLFQKRSQKILNKLLNNDYQELISISGEPIHNVRGESDVSLQKVSFIANFGFCKKDIFWKVGGFPDYKGYGFEDDCLMFRLFKESHKHVLLSSITVIHINHKITKNRNRNRNRNIIPYFQELISNGYYWFNVKEMFIKEKPTQEDVLEKLTPLHYDFKIENAYKDYKKIPPLNIKKDDKERLKYWKENSQFSKLRFSQLISLLQKSNNLDDFIKHSGSDFDNLAPLIEIALKFSFIKIKNKKGEIIKNYNFKFTTPFKFKKIDDKKIIPKQEYNQFPCDDNSKKERSNLFKERYPFAEYLRVGIVGDDDLLSLQFKNDYWLWPIVIEKDKNIVDIIRSQDNRVVVYERDFRELKTIPQVAVQTFITDPPYNLNGVLIFICAGLKMLTKENREKEFYVIMNRTMVGDSLFCLQKILSSAGIYLFSVIENFNQYNLPSNYKENERAKRFAQKIGVSSDGISRSSSSDLYIFKTTKFNIKKIEKFIDYNAIYGNY